MGKDGTSIIFPLALLGVIGGLLLVKRSQAEPEPEPVPNPLPPKAGDIVLNATTASNTLIIDVDNVTTKQINGKLFIDVFDISDGVVNVYNNISNVNLGSLESKKLTKSTGLTSGNYAVIISYTTIDNVDLAQISFNFVI